MRLLALVLVGAVVGCGGHGDAEPGDPSATGTAPASLPREPIPTGARPLSPDEPQLPVLTSTGGGPGSPSVSGAARAAQPLLLRCYLDEVRSGAVHAGFRGSLHTVVDATGAVTTATVTLHGFHGAGTGDGTSADVDPPDELVECLERTGRELRFPPAADGDHYEIPLFFSQGQR